MTKSISFTRWAFTFALLALVAMTPDSASAMGNFASAVCNLIAVIVGPIGRAVATIGIIFLGIGAFFGKVNWGLAIVVAIGVMGIFGAATIARNLGSQMDASAGGATCGAPAAN